MNPIARPSRSPHRIRRALALLVWLPLAGCATYRTVPSDAVAAPADVRIQFAEGRSVVVHNRNGDSLIVADVVELRGEVAERSAEMLTLEVTRAKRVGSEGLSTQRFGSGSVVRVAPEEIEIREGQAGRTVLLFGALLAAVLVVVAVATPDPAPPPPKDEPAKY